MKYLITGAAGFIGSHLVETLLQRGESVRGFDSFATGRRSNIAPFMDRIEFVEGDVRDREAVRDAVNGVDYILHQAALPSVPRSVADPATSNDVNVTGTMNMLVAARDAGVKRLVFASSSSVYGANPALPKVETMWPDPVSPYAVSKLAGEKYCISFDRIYGMRTIALRYFNVFGPRQDPDSQYSAVIPKFIKAMLAGQSPIIHGDGEQSRDFTYIDNTVSANLLAAVTECETGVAVNCACHDRITLNELVRRINIQLGTDIRAEYTEPRKGDVKHSFADISRAGELFGYRPVVSFDEGLGRTIASMREGA